ncbi:MAG: bifunctional 4-hydroxy-2-oxoglutarate aldolase/2-dehydro-3-deoxy-phosphogluconate aldolase [Acidobacteria bacterium]|nr:bifunctional 4-hydroxy-2-oxoglutarate aldolase/2-dehydro-3-deoxy-phosphogluconate aldolase [Acidobacteriota bacterium]
MMKAETTLRLIETGRVIAIMRGQFGGREEDIVAAIVEAGVTAVEVTLNSPNAIDSIERLARRFGLNTAIGAGTVLRPGDVERVADAGAQFIVSPNRNLEVIATTKRLGLVSLPGCFTPSETIEAIEAGADAVKLFPAVCLGVNFVRALRGPLPDVRLVPTGGVTPEAAREYFAAGAWAVGAGSELIGKDVMLPGGMENLRTRAAEFAAARQDLVRPQLKIS